MALFQSLVCSSYASRDLNVLFETGHLGHNEAVSYMFGE